MNATDARIVAAKRERLRRARRRRERFAAGFALLGALWASMALYFFQLALIEVDPAMVRTRNVQGSMETVNALFCWAWAYWWWRRARTKGG